ncbi:GNAT family N-acetyltransferase [Nonomuraea africana]|uniref:Ribosomal protein S18 acetylase RimI-like enzyme n=1 Tax=Nonomuraea africana TaxID=46171 RepID=A0ABR9KML6_9ACTN|nr:GNAT family N-acetyltransferase [Nonomuraea africana]MBE1563255.1 ribosomal protein S18 acetylase RimI-like enzyme [Nonomuraea africana]
MTEPVFRALADESEFALFDSITTLPTSGVGQRMRPFRELAAEGEYRPEWVWIAQRGERVVARAAFSAPHRAEHPWGLDYFDFDTVENGAALLKAAYAALVTPDYHSPIGPRPEYNLLLPADWRERPDAFAEANARIQAAEKAGLTFHVERLNLRWIPEYGLPSRSTRLTFTPVTDEQVLLDLMVHIVTGSLDAGDQADLRSMSPKEVAAHLMAMVGGMPGGRDRWRLAYNAAGELVGMVMPTRNDRSATTGYIGVDHRHRGHGYAYDLLAEAMHIFAEEGEPLIIDNTDVGNHPMAATFERIGYEVTGRRIVMT